MDNNRQLEPMVPAEIASKAEQAGVAKVRIDGARTFVLAVLAGAFIALGAVFCTIVVTGSAGALPFGITKLLGGLAFCLGLILVVGAGAELFTGNNLIVMAWAHRKVSTGRLLRNWGIVYVGNLVGAVLTAAGIYLTGQYTQASGSVGATMLNIAHGKSQLAFLQAVMLGVFCNALVCLAVWLAMSARNTTDKLLAVIFPITAFVAAGFEHCVANMYFIPEALFVHGGADAAFWADIGKTPADFPALTWSNFFLVNLLPVTIGNVIGGALMVGGVYWFIYLRRQGDD